MGLRVPMFVVLMVGGAVGSLVEGVAPARTLCPLVLGWVVGWGVCCPLCYLPLVGGPP